jgi:3-oxoacyl-[acyl-carrier-protein] synthase-3
VTRHHRITGWGIAVPDKVVTNDDLAVSLDTSDAWIHRAHRHPRAPDRRHHLPAGHRGRAGALAKAGRTADEIDHVILATTTPDGIVPGTSATVQDGSASRAGPSTSTPPAPASSTAWSRGRDARHRVGRLLLIGSETLRRITDMDDRSVAIIVGDGAGAVVVEPVDGPGSSLSWNLGADGSLRHLLKCEHGGYLYMDGKEVFRKAVRVVVESAERAMAEAGLGPDDIDADGPPPGQPAHHQAACQRLGIPEEKAVVVIDRYGNTSSASIPLALVDAISTGGCTTATTSCSPGSAAA